MTKTSQRGRPVDRKLPEPMPDTAEKIGLAIMRGPGVTGVLWG